MRVAYLAIPAFLTLTASALAGSVADAGAKAEKLVQANDHAAAIAVLDEAIAGILKEAPMAIAKALFVDKATGYGAYIERAAAVFKPGEPIIIYVEPTAFTFGKNDLGAKEFSLTTDFVLRDDKGETLFAKDDFVSVVQPVRYDNREVHFTLTIDLTGLPEGNFIGKFRVRDRHSAKSAMFDLPFAVKG